MTPTDASAVLANHVGAELQPGVDHDAAIKIARLIARQTVANGSRCASDELELSELVIEALVRRSAVFALQVALRSDSIEAVADDSLLEASLNEHRGAASVRVSLTDPIVAIGAPAAAYYPTIATLAGTEARVPEYAAVANAIGAVVGRVRVRRTATITQPSKGQFRVHLEDQPTFGSIENARADATARLTAAVLVDAEKAGASTPKLAESWSEQTAVIEGKEVFVEGSLMIEASGRPRF